jgi:hypothetical protein
MKSQETRQDEPLDGSDAEGQELAPIEVTWEEAGEHVATRSMADGWSPGLWDAFAGYGYWGYAEPERSTSPGSTLPESAGRWLLDEDDFSAEHGYEAGREGRSEFEHGEFERWV